MCTKSKFFVNFRGISPAKTHHVVEKCRFSYNSEKIIIYKKGIVMYNIVTVELGKVPLEGTGRGMLS